MGYYTSRSAGRRVQALETRELANQIVDALSDHLGEDILMLDIREASPLADYFVIANGSSDRQTRALVEAVTAVREEGSPRPRVEGDESSGWVLIDHGGVITHVFSAEKREFYDLESVWKSARTVVRLQ